MPSTTTECDKIKVLMQKNTVLEYLAFEYSASQSLYESLYLDRPLVVGSKYGSEIQTIISDRS